MTADTARSSAVPGLQPGTVLSDGTIVGDFIGRSASALNFYGEHPTAGRVVIKIVAPALDSALTAMADAIASLGAVRHASLQALVGRGTIGPRSFLVYEYVDGRNLRAVLNEVAAAGGAVDLPTTIGFVRSAARALSALHAVTAHGVLTSENLFVERDGRLKVTNIGFARVALCAFGAEGAEFRDSAYIAPEVRDDPWSASEASDIYSLGVLAVALLAGEHPHRESFRAMLELVCSRYPMAADALRVAVADEPVMRHPSMAELRAALQAADEVAGIRPREQESGPNVEPALGELLGGIELPDAPTIGGASAADGGEERWITSIDGRDYGPYTAQQIRDLLRRDEIDENTVVVDLYSQLSEPLIDVAEFTDFVIEYMPERAKRRIQQAERREEVVKQAKRTGLTTVVATAGAVLFGVWLLIALRVESPPLPLEDIVRPLTYTFAIDEPTYVEIAADPSLIASLFDFSDPVPEPVRAPGTRRSIGPDGSADQEPEEPSLDDFVLNFDGNRPARKLTTGELNEALAINQGPIQVCFQRELSANPDFRGVTVHVSIVPDGRTTNIRIDAHGAVTSEARTCLTRVFRRMTFPQFNDVPMNVSFPFRLQR